jgi:hypothetical protein
MKKLVLWMAGVMAGGVGVYYEWTMAPWWVAFGVAVAVLGITGAQSSSVTAKRHLSPEGKPHHFTLSCADETVILEPGKPWPKTDTFKWVMRGLIEDPQSFHVLANGTVEINAERITLGDPEGATKLELQINKHHPPSLAHKPPVIPLHLADLESAESGKVHFRVKLDHLGHMMIECTRGSERAETGLRGLPTLVQSGFMIKPGMIHVDPLQRSIELDGVRFECNATGARQLEEALNLRYAPALKPDDSTQIIVRENAASATGFDIDFVTIQGGTRLHTKGHLSQDKLNVLQDPQRCDLLHPGIVLRLSPPNLLIRRRRPDGGEEAVPEVPDVSYLRAEAGQLQQILNHPLVRRRTDHEEQPSPAWTAQPATGLECIRVTHNSQNRLFLWLECHYAGGKREGKAFTHHNVAELMHRGVFQHRLDISLSIDNHRLSILDLETREEQVITLSSTSVEDDLARASDLLTAALKQPTVPDVPDR